MRVLLIDDHPMVFDAFRSLLEREAPATQLEYLPNLGEGMQRLRRPPAIDLVILDLTLSGHPGVSALTVLQRSFPEMPVAVLSAADNPETKAACIAAGVRGYLPMTLERSALLNGLTKLLLGETFIAPNQAAPVFVDPAQEMAERFGLTARQVDVLNLLVQGKTNREIAAALDQSVNTTQVHVSAVLQAVGAANRTEAVAIAARFGLLAP